MPATSSSRSVNKLSPEQKFYVYFFNDRTFPLYDPKPAKGMQVANKTNKQRASAWIRAREPESTTNPNMALQQALEMKPEVIFLLTDGELDDPLEVRQMIKKFNKSNVVIHTIAFENEEGAMTLEAIARRKQRDLQVRPLNAGRRGQTRRKVEAKARGPAIGTRDPVSSSHQSPRQRNCGSCRVCLSHTGVEANLEISYPFNCRNSCTIGRQPASGVVSPFLFVSNDHA